jgi:predicted ABC-type ATPase
MLYLFAGPNGSGKSTLQKFLARRFSPISVVEFVNADEIAKKLRAQDSDARAEEARVAADKRRAELIEAKTSFCSETVFSHESKITLIEEAKRHGFKVYLFIVGVENASLSELRVMQRVERGGHSVPRERIGKRFPRSLQNLEKGLLVANYVLVFDNSVTLALPRLLLALEDGKLVYEDPEIPAWAKDLQAVARGAGKSAPAGTAPMAELIRVFDDEGTK